MIQNHLVLLRTHEKKQMSVTDTYENEMEMMKMLTVRMLKYQIQNQDRQNQDRQNQDRQNQDRQNQDRQDHWDHMDLILRYPNKEDEKWNPRYNPLSSKILFLSKEDQVKTLTPGGW